MKTMDAKNWSSFLTLLEEQSCVLMLGPNVPAIKKGQEKWLSVLPHLLANDLAKIVKAEGVEFDETQQNVLSYIAQSYLEIPRRKKLNLQQDIKELIQAYPKDIPPLYEDLAKLPFYLIVTTTPDDGMLRALKKEGKYPIEYNFNFRRTQPFMVNFKQITPETPLVISLFGSIQPRQEDSLLLTETDRMDFIKNIMSGVSKIPTELLKELQYLKAYLFLGFNWDNWELRLVLDSLHINDENIPYSPRIGEKSFSAVTKSLYTNRFNFQFVEKETTDFITHLVTDFNALKEDKDQPAEAIIERKTLLLYDPADREYAEQLRDFLVPLETEKRISIFPETMPGATISEDMEEKLREADVIFLLFSASFIASEVLYRDARSRALARYEDRSALVIPVIVRPCGWEGEVGSIQQILPPNKMPVTIWSNMDSAFNEIVNEFRVMLTNWI